MSCGLNRLSIAHEAAVHAAQLRVEISQSRKEQKEYLKNVELARVLGKRQERKRKVDDSGAADEEERQSRPPKAQKTNESGHAPLKAQPKERRKKSKAEEPRPDAAAQLDSVLGSIF